MRRSMPNYPLASKLEEYEMSRVLGEGTFGKVRLARHKASQELVAIKIMFKERIMESEQLNVITREIAILKSISHPNTIRLYEVIETETELFLVMEYIETSLLDYIEHGYERDEAQIAKILYQILAGIQYLHSLGIAHRDLKPSNILITKDKVVKIIDFGLSNMYKAGNKLHSPVGSPSYAAPQLIQNRSYNPLQIDIWSFGIIMYMLLTGSLPFQHKNINEFYKLVLAAKFDIPGNVTKLAQDLLRNILTTPASKRFKVKQIRTHPWMYYHTKNFELPKEPDQQHKQQLIFKILERQGFEKKDVEMNMEKKKHNKITALYHLYERKDTFRLEAINAQNDMAKDTNETSESNPIKTPRKIIRKPGMITPRMRSVTPNKRTFSSDKNKSYETYVKIQERPNLSNRIQTRKATKYIPLLTAKSKDSLGQITRHNFFKKVESSKIQSYFGPYCLSAVFTQKIEVLKSHILAYLKREKAVVDEVGVYKFQVVMKKHKFNLGIYCLNGVSNLLILRVLGDAPEDAVEGLIYYTRKFQ